ncbi:tumor necrosis factor receptor superfamily member 14-like [Dromiciops gliroides]|uniref:tumor necrosis factor receptor superfamily member 14-like n=1 Tax=Dromiciops gliroides TaxID=33562 RepID=UPI001CC6A48C|nr:tumor necrosis factor receptor superfamily member 14-like [Dromiciops gliroides]
MGKMNFLQMFRMLMITQPICFMQALECLAGEYEVDGQCCPTCHPAFGFLTRRECSSTSNTVCGCAPGYFCTEMKDDDCQKCVVHRVCNPGQYVKSRGTERKNTICERCPAGTFNSNGTLGHCLPWTNLQGNKDEMLLPNRGSEQFFLLMLLPGRPLALLAENITSRQL